MFKLTKKELTPDQVKRANITTSITVTLVYLACIFLTATSGQTPIEKIAFCTFYVVWYLVTAVFIKKNVDNYKSEVMIASGFGIAFGILCFMNSARVMMVIFPALLSLTVYLSEYLIICGSATTFFFVLTKIVMLYITNPPNKDEEIKIIFIVLISLAICVFGGCRAVKKLIEFSNEETSAVEEKVQKQLEIARNVDQIATSVDEQFTQVRSDLAVITETINNTQCAMETIAEGTETTVRQSVMQSEKTNEIQERLGNTNDIAVNAVETTKRLQEIVENGKIESDVLADQSVIVDRSIEQISNTISNLVEHVGKVSEITDVIMSISSQTNLLALNASIEAARAGEAGKGFAVVADEIRQLAEMTKSSTEQITQIMNQLSAITADTQSELKNTVESIDVQREKVHSVHDSFVAVEEDINSLVGNMLSVSDEVGAVLEANTVIVDGIETLSGISQEISANTNTTKSEMDGLHERIANFSVAVDTTSDSLEELKRTTATSEAVETSAEA